MDPERLVRLLLDSGRLTPDDVRALEAAKGGRRILQTAPFPHESETVGFSLEVREQGAAWLETRLFDEVERGAIGPPFGDGPLELVVHGGPVRLLSIRTRAR